MRLAVVVVGLLIPLTGCASWTPSVADPREVVASAPAAIRVYRLDGTTVDISRPTIQNDSIAESSVGQDCIPEASGRRACVPTRTAVRSIVALQDVRVVEVRRSQWGHTVALGVLAVPAAILLTGLIICTMSGCD
jgi:hypothetical protein